MLSHLQISPQIRSLRREYIGVDRGPSPSKYADLRIYSAKMKVQKLDLLGTEDNNYVKSRRKFALFRSQFSLIF